MATTTANPMAVSQPSREAETSQHTEPRFLFTSFTRLLNMMHQGRVSGDAIDNGLMLFGCRREHVFDENALVPHPERKDYLDHEALWFSKKYPEKQKRMLEQLQAHVLKAEQENRIVWRMPGEHITPNHARRLFEQAGMMIDDTLLPDYISPEMLEQLGVKNLIWFE